MFTANQLTGTKTGV